VLFTDVTVGEKLHSACICFVFLSSVRSFFGMCCTHDVKRLDNHSRGGLARLIPKTGFSFVRSSVYQSTWLKVRLSFLFLTEVVI